MPEPIRSPSSSPKSKSRIVIVEDHPIVRHGYAQLIGVHPDLEVCGFAATESEGLEQVKTQNPDLVIVDVSLKDGNGIELIKQLATRHPRAKLLVISAHDESLFAERSLDAGALGYINKQEATERLVDGIRKVLAGEVYLSETMTRRLLKGRVGAVQHISTSPLECLTDRELQIFELLGRGKTARVIAEDLFLSPKTVHRYRDNIRAKLNLANGTELVQRATQWVIEQRIEQRVE